MIEAELAMCRAELGAMQSDASAELKEQQKNALKNEIGNGVMKLITDNKTITDRSFRWSGIFELIETIKGGDDVLAYYARQRNTVAEEVEWVRVHTSEEGSLVVVVKETFNRRAAYVLLVVKPDKMYQQWGTVYKYDAQEKLIDSSGYWFGAPAAIVSIIKKMWGF